MICVACLTGLTCGTRFSRTIRIIAINLTCTSFTSWLSKSLSLISWVVPKVYSPKRPLRISRCLPSSRLTLLCSRTWLDSMTWSSAPSSGKPTLMVPQPSRVMTFHGAYFHQLKELLGHGWMMLHLAVWLSRSKHHRHHTVRLPIYSPWRLWLAALIGNARTALIWCLARPSFVSVEIHSWQESLWCFSRRVANPLLIVPLLLGRCRGTSFMKTENFSASWNRTKPSPYPTRIKSDSETIFRRFRNQISAIPQPKSDTLPQPKKGTSATKKEPISQPKITDSATKNNRFRNQKKAIPQPKQEDFATKKRPFPNHHPHDSETNIRVTIAATVNIASSPDSGGVGWGGVG